MFLFFLMFLHLSCLYQVCNVFFRRYDKFMAAFDHVSTKIDDIYKVRLLILMLPIFMFYVLLDRHK